MYRASLAVAVAVNLAAMLACCFQSRQAPEPPQAQIELKSLATALTVPEKVEPTPPGKSTTPPIPPKTTLTTPSLPPKTETAIPAKPTKPKGRHDMTIRAFRAQAPKADVVMTLECVLSDRYPPGWGELRATTFGIAMREPGTTDTLSGVAPKERDDIFQILKDGKTHVLTLKLTAVRVGQFEATAKVLPGWANVNGLYVEAPPK